MSDTHLAYLCGGDALRELHDLSLSRWFCTLQPDNCWPPLGAATASPVTLLLLIVVCLLLGENTRSSTPCFPTILTPLITVKEVYERRLATGNTLREVNGLW